MYKYDIKTIHLGISAVIYKYDMICDICDICEMSLRIQFRGVERKNITSTRFHPGNSRWRNSQVPVVTRRSEVVGKLSLEHHLRQFLHQPIEKGANLLKDESGKTNVQNCFPFIWAAAFIYDVAAVKKIDGVPPPRFYLVFQVSALVHHEWPRFHHEWPRFNLVLNLVPPSRFYLVLQAKPTFPQTLLDATSCLHHRK